MFFPRPIVAYCKERMNGRSLMSPHIVANQENKEDDHGRGAMQIELQQVFIKDVLIYFNFSSAKSKFL